jgi:hypothetical protein
MSYSPENLMISLAALGSSGNASEATAAPLLTSVATAINSATASLQAIDPTGEVRLAMRQSGNELADLVAGIINSILQAVNTLVGDLGGISLLSGLLSGIDAALSNVSSSMLNKYQLT